MAKPIQIAEHKRLKLEAKDGSIEVRLEYNTKKDPEWKQARGGFNIKQDRKTVKSLIKQLKAMLPEE